MRYALYYLRRHYKLSNSLKQLAKHMHEAGVISDSGVLYVIPKEGVSGAWEQASSEQRQMFLKEVERLTVIKLEERREKDE